MACEQCMKNSHCKECGSFLADKKIVFEVGKNSFCTLLCLERTFPNGTTATVALRSPLDVPGEEKP